MHDLPGPGEIAPRVIAILAQYARRDPAGIALSEGMEALGLDSMAMVEAVFAIEEAFDITVPFNPQEEAGSEHDTGTPGFDTSSVGTVIAAVEALVAARAALR